MECDFEHYRRYFAQIARNMKIPEMWIDGVGSDTTSSMSVMQSRQIQQAQATQGQEPKTRGICFSTARPDFGPLRTRSVVHGQVRIPSPAPEQIYIKEVGISPSLLHC